MKRIALIILVALLGGISPSHGQFFKKLKKRAEEAAKETVFRKTEEKSAEETEKAMDSILNVPGKKKRKKKKGGNTNDDSEYEDYENEEEYYEEEGEGYATDERLEVYSKFDFVPGDKTLFFDDFSKEFVGDFPSKWNTNSGGELVKINEGKNKWLKLLPGFGSTYLPDLTDLPEEFTIEFDVLADGLDNKTSSQAFLRVSIGDNNSFEKDRNLGFVEYSFCQYGAQSLVVENSINGKRGLRNNIQADYRDLVYEQHHISIAVNKQRFRMWINETKYVDVPRLLPSGLAAKSVKFHLRGTDVNKENIYISNIKIAEGGQDLRRTLLAEGRISTNAILFESGSSNLQPQSMGVIRQIYQVLDQEGEMSLLIVGHTDSDGDDSQNMELSLDRAEAVKNALVSVYGISEDRLQTDGKGETSPIGDNNTSEGKAQNRRVDFIRI